MTTSTTRRTFVPADHELSFAGTLRSEWIKLRSVRSTWWSFATLVALTVGVGAQVSSSLSFIGVDAVVTREVSQSLAVYALTVSTDIGALVVSVLGVLTIAGEYGTGMIRSTLIAVPQRTPALFAKALVFAATTFVVSAASFAITVPISVALLTGNQVEVDAGDAQYWLSLLGAAGYLVLVGLIAFAIGAIIRNTAGGIAVALGFLLAAPLVLSLMLGLAQQDWIENLAMLLPSNAGKILFGYPAEYSWANPNVPVEQSGWITEPWQGGLVLVAWVAALLTAAAVLLERRDA